MQDINRVKEKIEQEVGTNKNDLYNSHLYWSQKPYNICQILIEELSCQGDVIFDSFMGSGVTLIEAVNNRYNRKAIGCEINEVPIFIARSMLNKYNIEKVIEAIKSFSNEVSKLETYYYTTCETCGGEALVENKAIVDKVIFDRKDRNDVGEIKEIYYKCLCSKKVLKKQPSIEDIKKFNVQEETKFVKNDLLIENSRLAVGKGETIKNIFTPRSIVILDKILQIIDAQEEDVKEYLRFIFLTILHSVKITDLKSNSQWPLWTPKQNCLEKNIIKVINKKCNDFIKAISYADISLNSDREMVDNFYSLEDGKFMILNKPVQSLTQEDLPDDSVDLVITDPPYLGQVLYSEYMQLYKSFLNLQFNLVDEIVISSAPSRNKTEEDYYKLLTQAFKTVGRVLKIDKYMCLYFHDANLNVWDKLIRIMNECNLKYVSQVHVRKSKNTLKNIISPKKSLNGDAIIFFKKSDDIMPQDNKIEDVNQIEKEIISIARLIIREQGCASTPLLYDNGVLEYIINRGILSELAQLYNDLTEVFDKYLIWDGENGVWKE